MSALPDPHLLVTILLAALFGGIVRGYSGFGFALAAMPILTIAMSPVQAVPVVFPLEFAIGVLTLPMERRSIDLRVLKWLALGALLGTPIGVTVVALLPTEWTRLLLGLAVGVAVIRAWKQETTPTYRAERRQTGGDRIPVGMPEWRHRHERAAGDRVAAGQPNADAQGPRHTDRLHRDERGFWDIDVDLQPRLFGRYFADQPDHVARHGAGLRARGGGVFIWTAASLPADLAVRCWRCRW